MKKIIVAMLILSVCILAACDNSSQPVVSGTGTGTETETPPVTPPADTSVVGNTVPDGAFFANTNSDLGYNLEYSNIKVAGEAFPDTFQTGDVFLYNGYMYIYGFDVDGNSITDGWSVIVADDMYETVTAPAGFEFLDITTITEVGLICESINGKPIKSMSGTFNCCYSLVSLPAGFTIPSGVTDTSYMFGLCYALASLPAGFTIPSGVTQMEEVFWYCYKLSDTITINANPTSYSGCFMNAGKDGSGIVLAGSSTMLDVLAAEKGTEGIVSVAP